MDKEEVHKLLREFGIENGDERPFHEVLEEIKRVFFKLEPIQQYYLIEKLFGILIMAKIKRL